MNRRLGVQLIAIIATILFIFSSLSFNVLAIPPITQDTIVVDITGNGDYTSIEEAISNADITNVLLIRKGTYNEHSMLIGDKIEIIGEDPSNTIINCSGNIAFTIRSSFIDISNLQIINTEEFAISLLPGSNGCTINNCIIDTNYKGTAIDIRSDYNIISNCRLIGKDTSKQGVKVNGIYNIVEDCEIQNFGNGIQVSVGSNYNEIKNCNILNNENGIDIRASSDQNVVTGCNVYSNLQSIKIWQSSNDNLVYLNNFWKNDVVAIDEANNTWDNGQEGNYWDRYNGRDSNSDGIGDTPYTISVGNVDNFPLVSMILPDIIIRPTNVKLTTSKSDSTPSFSWNPSIYSKGIKGYYVKIDNNKDIFIGDTTSWTSSDTLLDGIHMFYVKGLGFDNATSNYSILSFSIDSSIIDTDGDGWSDIEEEEYGTDPNNSNNYPLDTDTDHIPDSIDSDDDDDGYSDEMESSYATSTVNLFIYPLDTDFDGIPNEDSPDRKYKGDEDDDGDGLADTTENSLGSSPTNGEDAILVYVGGKSYYLVDISGNEIFDFLYVPTSGATNGIEKYGVDYRMDVDGDGSYDHIFRTSDGIVSTYSEQITIPTAVWLLIVLIILFAALYFVPRYLKERFIKFKLTRKPEKTFKTSVMEKTLKIPLGEKKDTVMMIGQTKALLQHIHQDVEVYMQKLRELEQQFTTMPTKDEVTVEESKEKEPPIEKLPKEELTKEEIQEKETPSETKDIRELEAKVDNILSALDDKDKN